MTKSEFMKELEDRLFDIPDDERQNALEFYAGYFDDAGPQREEQVIGDLGSPEKVAATIRLNLNNKEEDSMIFTEYGFEDTSMEKERYEMIDSEQKQKDRDADWNKEGTFTKPFENKKDTYNNSSGKIILIIIACVILLPAILSVGGGILGTLLGLAGAVIFIIIALIGSDIGLLFGGIGMIAAGAVRMFTSPMGGIATLGVGMLMLGLGIFLLLLIVWLCTKVIPGIIKFIIKTVSNFVKKRKKGEIV